MNNKGQITVFLCLIITCLMGLMLAGIQSIKYYSGKSKTAICTRQAMSGVKAGYNSYIFENYHILLFDKTMYGRGEAALEEQLCEDIQSNLGEGFSVSELAVKEYSLVLNNDCQTFKEQIKEYAVYGLAESGVEGILQAAGGEDGEVADWIKEDINSVSAGDYEAVSWSQNGQENTQTAGEPHVAEETSDTACEEGDDPREFTEDLTDTGLLSLVIPEGMEVSGEDIDLKGLPSAGYAGRWWNFDDVDREFEDLDILLGDLDKCDTWKDELIEGGAGVMYAGQVFNCATDKVNEDTVFAYELEYIICGETSDYKNVKGIVNRIIAMRLPVNYTYLVSDKAKMAQIKGVSSSLAFAVLVPEPVLRYLLAGCWAYVEAIVDTRCLLEGRKLPFTKNKDNWITDLNDLENSVNYENESDTGLCYEDYLLILLSMDMDIAYLRMLDVIELNTRQYYPEFSMGNAAVGLELNVTVEGEYGVYYLSNYEEY